MICLDYYEKCYNRADISVKDHHEDTPFNLTTNEEIKALLRNAALLEAVKSGNISEVKHLLSEGADVNAKDNDEQTSLHLAAKENHEEVVKALLDKGANVDIENDKGKTPLGLATEEEIKTLLKDTAALLEAAKNDNIDEVTNLINAGASVNATNKDGDTPLHLAAEGGKQDVVEFLLTVEGVNVNAVNKDGITPLHSAAQNGHKDIVNALISAKADVDAKAALDITPLLFASSEGHKDVVKILLDNGADVNAENIFNGLNSLCLAAKNGHTGVVEVLLKAEGIGVKHISDALYFAVTSGHEGVVKALLKTEEIDVKYLSRELCRAAKNGHTGVVEALLTAKEIDVNEYFQALGLAAENNHEGVVRVLLTTEKINVAAKDASGKTLLHLAVEKGYKEIVQALLSRGADVNAVDKDRNTPLHLAAINRHKVVVEALLEKEGISVNAVDHNKNTPLHLAAKNGHTEIVSALVEAKGINIDAVDHNKNTPLHLAAEKGSVEIVNTILGKGADVNIKNGKGETPLYLAVEYSHVDVVKALIKEGADVNKALGFANSNDETLALLKGAALLDAAKNSDVDEVYRLISVGANVNVQDKDGRTPLHLATLNDSTKIVGTLIKAKGIDIYAKDNKNNTPLDLARQNNQNEVVKVLGKAQKNIEALYLAVKDGSAREVEKLLQDLLRELSDVSIGANVNIVDKDGNTPLHFAASLNKTEVVKILINYLADVTIKNKDKKTPLDLTTKKEIKTLLKNAEKYDDGESSTDNEGDQEEDAGEEKQEDEENSEEEPKSGQVIIAEQGTHVKIKSVGSGASAESAQTEEQPSSFFGSLFSILTKPFSLIASFFSEFFYGYLALTEKTLMNITHNLMFLYLHPTHWTMIVMIE